jgi:valyl-tRNA synthetase
MMMMGIHFTGVEPFSVIYLHGLVRNENGLKISKSMPDAWRYDPLYMIDEFGQDPLRFTLLTGSTPGNDMKLAPDRVEANRNFGNKIWQAARFVLGNLGEDADAFRPHPQEPLAITPEMDTADRWVLSRYHRLVEHVTRLVDAYQFGEAGRQIYDFVWGEYCDWYIEMTKTRFDGESGAEDGAASADTARRVLIYVLEGCLRLLHPYMPFITETIWQYLPHDGEALIVAPWPQAGAIDDAAVADMESLMELVRAIRNARSEEGVEPGRWIAAIVAAGDKLPLLQEQRAVLSSLARIDAEQLTLAADLEDKPEQALALITADYEAYLPLAALVDLDRERERLTKELAEIDGEIARAAALLAKEGFVTKAPEAVVQRERDKLADAQERRATVQERLDSLG